VTRLFGRGELKVAILDTLGEIEPANGYAIMQALADAVGGGWRPSPGAIYPALLGLQDAGLIESDGADSGSLTYRLTDTGRRHRGSATGVLSAAADRARTAPAQPTLGSLVDAFATAIPERGRRLGPTGAAAVERLLQTTRARLDKLIDKETTDG